MDTIYAKKKDARKVKKKKRIATKYMPTEITADL